MFLIKRACDLCNENNHEKIYSYSKKLNINNDNFTWKVNNVVCNNCGFAFVSPVPNQDIFTQYFQNKVSIYNGSKIDYSIPKRMALINKYRNICGGNSFVEIGSNNCPQFLSEISQVFQNIVTVEANENCKSTYKNIDDLPKNSAHIIVSYLVIDNFVNPLSFLTRCAETIKDVGYVILEVPHLYLYPQFPAGLILFEHLSHFSPNTLACLAQKAGLSLVEVSQEYSSRPFGFAAVFKKEEGDYRDLLPNKVERLYARNCVREGKEKIVRIKNNLDRLRNLMKQCSAKNEIVLIWGVNDVCEMLLENFDISKNVFIVDSDERKKSTLLPLPVFLPSEVSEKIKVAKLLILNSPRHQDEIASWIQTSTGRKFSSNEIQINSMLMN